MTLQIIEMIPEGTEVKEGDFLVQFDTVYIGQLIDDRLAELDITRSNMVRNLASMGSQMASLESSKENSLASHRLAELRLEQMKFEAEVRIEEGKLSLKQADISLKQSEQQVVAQKLIDSADVRSLELKIKQAELDLAKSIRDRNRLRISAPSPGMVIYKEMWKGGEMTKVKVGDTPWRGAALIDLPDLSVMMVETSVNEVDIAKVEVGQEVEVKLDAYPEPTFSGEVVDVSVLAGREDGVSDANVFKILVRINESNKLLRPGMSATARIICNRIPDKLWVPIESVFESEDEMIVWKVDGRSLRKTPVKLGERNDNFVIVESSLKKDDKVTTVDPVIAEENQSIIKDADGSMKNDVSGNGTSGQKRSKRGRHRRG